MLGPLFIEQGDSEGFKGFEEVGNLHVEGLLLNCGKTPRWCLLPWQWFQPVLCLPPLSLEDPVAVRFLEVVCDRKPGSNGLC